MTIEGHHPPSPSVRNCKIIIVVGSKSNESACCDLLDARGTPPVQKPHIKSRHDLSMTNRLQPVCVLEYVLHCFPYGFAVISHIP
jgi:hypothetical protein